MTFVTLEQLIQGERRQSAEAGEVRAAVSLLSLGSVHLTWSNFLNRCVAYLPEVILAAAPGEAINTIRTAFGCNVLVMPDRVRLP
jgi:hypothetical protein